MSAIKIIRERRAIREADETIKEFAVMCGICLLVLAFAWLFITLALSIMPAI